MPPRNTTIGNLSVGAGTSLTNAPLPQGELAREIFGAHQRLDQVINKVQVLFSRLQPVIAEKPLGANPTAKTEGALTEHGRGIRELSNKIEGIDESVNHILDCLEI